VVFIRDGQCRTHMGGEKLTVKIVRVTGIMAQDRGSDK
jgi:hypothetical protein